MAIYGGKLTFKQPSKAQVALTSDLVNVIREHHSKSREHLFHLCMIAYGLRTHNLTRSKGGAGGNAKGEKFKVGFRGWYNENQLGDIYGSFRGNFTNYAMAGRLLEYVRWQVSEKYIAHLPNRVTALYALSQILWTQGDTATDASRKLFENALIQPIKDGSKHNALIHPLVTRKEIDKWRHKHITALAGKSKSAKVDKADPRNIVIATVKVHKDLMKFTKATGEKKVGPKLEDVQVLIKKLQDFITSEDKGKARFALSSHLDDVTAAYMAAKNPNFGKNIIDEDRSNKRLAKKSLAKKA